MKKEDADVNHFEVKRCKYETRILNQEDFKDLYKEEWSNALCVTLHIVVQCTGYFCIPNIISRL